MTRRDAEAHQRVADAKRPIFFDRGLPDVIGYRRLEGLPVPDTLQSLCRDRRYHPRVFIAPPWPEIYANDAERRQSLAEAERTYRMMREVYLEFGYELLELPRVSVGERVAFVQRQLRP